MFRIDAWAHNLGRRFYGRLSRTGGLILPALIVLSWGALLACFLAWRQDDAVAALAPAAPAASASPALEPPGRWGELEITPITISPPADLDDRVTPTGVVTWHFPDVARDGLNDLLSKSGLTDFQRSALLDTCTADPQTRGLKVTPDAALVLSLSPATRAALYTVLRGDKRNPQADPFRRPADPAQDWFADSGLSDAAAALARKLVYRHGDMEVFADLDTILPLLDPADRGKLFRALKRQPAVLARLRVGPESDIGALATYWGAGGREREVAPMLEALAKVPGGNRLSVAQLLPPFAKARAFTFPQLEGSTVRGRFHCHWTSLNFWNAIPDDQLADPACVTDQLIVNYHPVEAPGQLGDLIFFADQLGRGVHSAVFVADGIVFTKNGDSLASPYVLMRLPDLVNYYEVCGPVTLKMFRKNGL